MRKLYMQLCHIFRVLMPQKDLCGVSQIFYGTSVSPYSSQTS